MKKQTRGTRIRVSTRLPRQEKRRREDGRDVVDQLQLTTAKRHKENARHRRSADRLRASVC